MNKKGLPAWDLNVWGWLKIGVIRLLGHQIDENLILASPFIFKRDLKYNPA